MSRRSKSWPTIYPREYPTGRTKYVVDLGMQNGTRARMTFDTRGEAEAFAQQARAARQKQGSAAFFLPRDVQAQAIKLYDLLTANGLTLDDAYQRIHDDVIPFLTAPKVAELVDRLMAHVQSKGGRPNSHKNLRGFLDEFSRRFGDRHITDIQTPELEDFCFQPNRQRPFEPITKKNRRTKASQLYNFAIANDWAIKNLARRLPVPRQKDKTPGILTVVEVSRLLLAADEFGFLGYAVLSLFGGIRPDEAKKLDWSFVHVDDQLIEVPEHVSKIHEAREVPINPTMAAWLPLCRRPSGPIVDSADFYNRLADWRTAAQVKNWPNDVLRHCFASYHVAVFRNPTETARQMGHISGLRMLKKYYLAFVPKAIALDFWAIRPVTVSTAPVPVAA